MRSFGRAYHRSNLSFFYLCKSVHHLCKSVDINPDGTFTNLSSSFSALFISPVWQSLNISSLFIKRHIGRVITPFSLLCFRKTSLCCLFSKKMQLSQWLGVVSGKAEKKSTDGHGFFSQMGTDGV